MATESEMGEVKGEEEEVRVPSTPREEEEVEVEEEAAGVGPPTS